MEKKFLFITARHADLWAETLAKALLPLGQLETCSLEQAATKLGELDYSVVVVDSLVTEDPVALISDLLKQRPGARIIVVTYSPTWSRARDVIQAGAMDYFPKTMVQEEIRKKIEAVLHVSSE